MLDQQEHETHKGYTGIFLDRSGEGARDLTEILLSPPKFPLTDDEKQEAYAFEAELYNHVLDGGDTASEVLRYKRDEDVRAPMFFAEAFVQGEVVLPESKDSEAAPSLEIPSFANHAEVYKWLAIAISDQTIDAKTLRLLANSSKDFYKKSVTESLSNERDIEEGITDYMPMVLEPDNFVRSSLDLQTLRDYLRDQCSIHRKENSRLDGAKRAIVEVYLAKTNAIIAAQIPQAAYLIEQSRLAGDSSIERAAGAIPGKLLSVIDNPVTRSRVFQRLDYLRNGLGHVVTDFDAKGRVVSSSSSAISEKVQGSESDRREAVFSPEQKRILQSIMLSTEEMTQLFTNIIRKAGLLSSEDPKTWSPSRATRAADGLFQVVVNPAKDSFAADSTSGTYKVSPISRSIYDAMVIGGSHELEHLNQAQADIVMSEIIHLCELRGKRVLGLRETGADLKQREFEMRLFGSSKPVAMAYAKALEAIEQQGSVDDAIKAFYNEKLRLEPNGSKSKFAKEASDRVLRLLRGGGFNSQAMSYAEESILMDEMSQASEAVRNRSAAITSLDLVDQVRLHEYDLLPPITESQSINWSAIVLEEFAPIIAKALSSTDRA